MSGMLMNGGATHPVGCATLNRVSWEPEVSGTRLISLAVTFSCAYTYILNAPVALNKADSIPSLASP